ncbi:MAG: bZIP transcription factor [Cyclobacteriaceae bacterium]
MHKFVKRTALSLVIIFNSFQIVGQIGNAPSNPLLITNFNQSLNGTTRGFTEVLPMGPPNHAKDEPNVWYKFTYPSNTDFLKIEYTPNSGLGKLILYDQSGIDLWNSSTIDQPLTVKQSGSQGGKVTSIEENLTPGQTYYFTLYTYYGATDYTLKLSTIHSEGDSPQTAFPLDLTSSCGNSKIVNGTTRGFNEVSPMGPPNHAKNEPNVWYKFTYPPNTDFLEIEYTPNSGLGRLILYDQSGIDLWNSSTIDQPLTVKQSGSQGGKVTSIEENLTPGQTYYFTLYTYYGATDYTLKMIYGDESQLWNISSDVLFTDCAKVGIGTSNVPEDYLLAVDGKVTMEEIKVQLSENWPDFVFDNDYSLKTLEEVEIHINENGHLPDIPSETEVIENGINLGEMDSKLLHKIEELTLYMIEMNKQVQLLKSENQELKEKVQRLENE